MSEYSVKDYGNITNTKIYGLDESIVRAKYPMSVDTSILNSDITKGILALSNCEKGTGHDQWLTGVIVQFDLTYTVKAWTEAERYHFLDFISSQSTMHRITKFDVDKQYIQYVDERIIYIMKKKIEDYNMLLEDSKALTVSEAKRMAQEDLKVRYLEILYSNPCGFKLTAKMTTNYRQLKTIYSQRKNHRLPEWRAFCRWIETLPMFKEYVLGEKVADSSPLGTHKKKLVSEYDGVVTDYGTVGEYAHMSDSDGNPLYVGDVVEWKDGNTKGRDFVVKNRDKYFVMGFCSVYDNEYQDSSLVMKRVTKHSDLQIGDHDEDNVVKCV